MLYYCYIVSWSSLRGGLDMQGPSRAHCQTCMPSKIGFKHTEVAFSWSSCQALHRLLLCRTIELTEAWTNCWSNQHQGWGSPGVQGETMREFRDTERESLICEWLWEDSWDILTTVCVFTCSLQDESEKAKITCQDLAWLGWFGSSYSACFWFHIPVPGLSTFFTFLYRFVHVFAHLHVAWWESCFFGS